MRTPVTDPRAWLLAGPIGVALAAVSPAAAQQRTATALPVPPVIGQLDNDGENNPGSRYLQPWRVDDHNDRQLDDDDRDQDDRDGERRRRDQIFWFTPLSSYLSNGAGGVVPFVERDYLKLFTADSQWGRAKDRIQIFKIYSQLVAFGPDSTLTTIFAYLRQNDIALALEEGPLTPTARCGQVEGYGGGPAEAVKMARRIKSLGGNLAYVAMDEPLYFGHYDQEPGACQSPIQFVAQQAGATARAFRTVFPDVQIGDIEPVNGFANAAHTDTWLADTKEWIDGFRAAAGFPLAFFHDDATWSVPLDRFIPELQDLLKQEDIPFGMIFDGTDNPVSDAGWMAAAEEHIRAYNSSGNVPPAHVIFQTWNAYPAYALPETSPTALTYLVNFFFSPQARLSPAVNLGKDMVLLPGGAAVFRSTCDLNALGAAPENPTNEVAYVYCLVLARAADAGGLQGYAAALANGSITLKNVLDDAFTSTEFRNLFSVASTSNSDFVAFLYGLLLFRLPAEGEADGYVAALASGRSTGQQVFDSILQLPEFAAKNRILRGLGRMS